METLNNKANIVVLADLHFGSDAIDPRDMTKQLKKFVLKPIKESKKIDAVVIAGDTAHKILSMSSPAGIELTNFLTDLTDLSIKLDFEVHIIKGTYSHDGNQLDLFEFLTKDERAKVYIYTKPCITYICGVFKTLILPDGSYNKKERKKLDKLVAGEYDLIFGHGTISKLSHMHQESENMPVNPYLYDVELMMANCKGPIAFGHIHPYHNIKDKFFYVGSFTLLEANIKDCGYMLFAVDKDDPSDYIFTRIINTDSSRFYRLDITEEDLVEFEPEFVFKIIDQILSEIGIYDRLMIKFFLHEKSFVIDRTTLIYDRYFNEGRVNFTKKIINKDREKVATKLAEDRKKYSYLTDPNIPFNDKVIKFYKDDVQPTNPRYSTIVIDNDILEKIFGKK